MSSIDDFASSLLEEAKRFLEKAEAADVAAAKCAFLHAALMVGFCGFEAHINAIADDFAERPEVTPHEKGVLMEREVRLDDGEFVDSNSLRIFRLEGRICFIYRRISGRPLDRTAIWWSNFNSAIKLRNELTHPKGVPAISVGAVTNALKAVIETLHMFYEGVYRKGLPSYGYGLQSQLDF